MPNSIHNRVALPHAANALIYKDGLVLACKRRTSDLWSLPGGKVGEGESPMEAVIRELREETGLAIRPSQCMFFYEGVCDSIDPVDKPYWVYSFLCEIDADIHPSEMLGETSIRWMPPAQFLESTAFPEFNKATLKRAGIKIQG